MPSSPNAQHLNFLLLWALAGLLISPPFLRARGGWRYAAEYTAFWSLVTLGTYLGLRFGLLRGLEGETLLGVSRAALLYSLGLDSALYPLAGGWMFTWGYRDTVHRWRLYGIAM